MVGAAVVSIVKKGNVPWVGDIIPSLPLAPFLKQDNACVAVGEFGQNAGIKIPTLIAAPGDEAGAPRNTSGVSVPARL